MSTLSLGALSDELRHLSDGAVSAAHQLGQGATDVVHHLGQGAADAAHQLGRRRPRRQRAHSLLRAAAGRPVLWLVVGALLVLAARRMMMRSSDAAGAGRPGDVPDRVEPADIDEAAVAADLGGAMA